MPISPSSSAASSSGRTAPTGRSATWALRRPEAMCLQFAVEPKDQSNGFMVLTSDNVSSAQIESILRMDGLYKYTFTRHGDGEAGINSYPDPYNPVSPAERYTKYGISSMVLQACGSAATDYFSQDNQKAGIVKYDNWEINVAKAVFCRLQRGYKTVRRVIPLESRERSESCQLR